jgi:DNA-binding NtrC family response regulator
MLEKCEGDKAKAADMLGIGLSSLYRKIDDLEIDSESD